MKTLLVTYLPSGENSKTRKLLDAFMASVEGQGIRTLDLLAEHVPVFSRESMAAYTKRNYQRQALAPAEAALLARHDELIAQLKDADVLVMAYPMHNFGMPGAVKSWFDAVMFAGETFAIGPKGPEPVMKDKKFLTLYTSGGAYASDRVVPSEFPQWDALAALARIEGQFMGFGEVEVVGTTLRDPAKAALNLSEAERRIREITGRWYGQAPSLQQGASKREAVGLALA